MAASSGVQLTTQANILFPGFYAWVATVLTHVLAREAPRVAVVPALLALVALLVGPLVVTRHPRVGRGIGILGFVALSLFTWALCPSVVAIEDIDPVQAAFGALGWVFFAFGWGAVRAVGRVPEDDPHVVIATPLPARGSLPVGAFIVFAISLLGAAAPLVAAWRVTRPQHALMAHAIAALSAVAMVSVGAELAVNRSHERTPRASAQRLRSAARPLFGLLLVAGLGVLWLLLR